MSLRPDDAHHSARVLIVDDDRHDRQLLEVMLAQEGLLLTTAASGEEALAVVAQQPPDLILLDIVMPGMDGYEVAARIKGNVATTNIPVIMVTALDDRGARMRGLEVGAEDFLTKPVDLAELRLRVRNLLRLKAYSDHFDNYSQTLEIVSHEMRTPLTIIRENISLILEGAVGAVSVEQREFIVSAVANCDRLRTMIDDREVASRTADLFERTEEGALLAEQAALLDLAPDAIIVRDMSGRILFWNHGAELLYGWLSDEALGRNMHQLLKSEAPQAGGPLDTALLRQGQWEGEAIHHTRAGTQVIVAVRLALQCDAIGTPVRVLAINNDITGRKASEKALEQSQEDQLRFKDEFLSHVSHELRSPLTAIKQFTMILLGGLAGELTTTQRDYQQIVLKNIQQLQGMIDDLLEVTRLETGKLTLELEPVSVPDAVTDTCNTVQITAREKGVTLSCDVPPELPSARTDQTRLRQILLILLENAIEFTPEGGAVTVQARLLQQDPRFLLLEVSDTGCGIDPDMTEKIFERLHQATGPTRGSRKGLGLGLHIGKEMVARLGGRIWVNSERHKGSTFSFTLPVSPLNDLMAQLVKDVQRPASLNSAIPKYEESTNHGRRLTT